MAIIAGRRGLDMVRTLTLRHNTIMTAGTGAYHFIVVHQQHGRPTVFPVTGLAQIAAVDMRRRFPGGLQAVMTGVTRLPLDRAVIKLGDPRKCIVAALARLVGLNVAWPFAHGDNVVVTILTQPDHLIVVDQNHRLPSGVLVTGLANIAAVDVIRGLTGGLNSIMAL